MTKIRNKKTGEIIDLTTGKKEGSEPRREEPKLQRFKRRFKERSTEAEERIEKRGTIQSTIRSQLDKSENQGKLMATLTAAGAPFAAIESAISNPVLLAQQGNFSPGQLLKEAVLGATLQRQGQFGDVYKNIGVQKEVADTIGLATSIVIPAKILSSVGKSFGRIAKMSDKGIMKAGKQLVKASDEARKAAGVKVGKAFAAVDDIAADGVKFIDDVVGLPKAVLKKAEDVFGNIDDFADKLTVGKLREFKRFIGSLRPTAFGKAERGVAENIDVMDLNKVYGATKNLIKKSIAGKKDKRVVDALMNLEDSFSEVVKAGNFIRKSVIDPTLRKATKGGGVARSLIEEGTTTTRTALNTLKSAGPGAKKAVLRALRSLESFNRAEKRAAIAQKVAGAVLLGGAAGAIGGRALQSVAGKQER